MNETITKFGYPETVVKEYGHWLVMLRPVQVTLGSLVIAAKSEATHLGEIDEGKWSEFATVCSETEDLLRRVFGAEKFNYLALMMVDPHVHFHLIPRYSAPVIFNSKEYVDADWPSKTELKAMELSEEDIISVQEALTS